jgi:hypothetical protein
MKHNLLKDYSAFNIKAGDAIVGSLMAFVTNYFFLQ